MNTRSAFSPYSAEEPNVGDKARVRKTMTVADQGLYTGICGNMHPLYVNEVHAASSPASGRLSFELAVASLATTALAEVGGAYRRIGAIELRFTTPTRVGDTIAAEVEIAEVSGDTVRCRVTCRRDEGGDVVAAGMAELIEVR